MRVLQGNPPWACLWIRHELLRPIPPWSLQQLGRLVGNPPYHPDGPSWLAGLGLRRWYTYLVYPQQAPYEVEVWYDGAGEQFFKGGWSDFAEDHDLRQGFFMTFDFHIGTSKFDVRIYDDTQCQKEYEAKVHFH
jgi:hypothetical protein